MLLKRQSQATRCAPLLVSPPMKWSLSTSLILLFVLFDGASAIQNPFASTTAMSPTPATHPAFPAHKLRIHHPDASLCDTGGSRAWSGYLDVDLEQLPSATDDDHSAHPLPKNVTEHFYFYVQESRNNPLRDPIILWLNGGPGCTSFGGMLNGIGSCSITEQGELKFNPSSWTNNATVVFLDQPLGVGFSYSYWTNPKEHDKNEEVPSRTWDTPSAAKDVSAFLHLLALHSKEVFGSEENSSGGISRFHMAGESYAGRYLPLIFLQVLKDNEEALRHPERGLKPLPIESIMIGNGLVSPIHQFPAYVDYVCKNRHGFGQLISDEDCKALYQEVPICKAYIEQCNVGNPTTLHYDSNPCQKAFTLSEKLTIPYAKTGRSPYNINHQGKYLEKEWITKFLNDPMIQRKLGVDSALIGDDNDGKFVSCSQEIHDQFVKSGDIARSSLWAVQEILNKGIRVLVYAGVLDFICNFEGIEAWTLDMQWSGAEEYRTAKKVEWFESGLDSVKGDLAGRYKTVGNFTYVEVDGAGHYVPRDKPNAALSMVNHWLHGSRLDHTEL